MLTSCLQNDHSNDYVIMGMLINLFPFSIKFCFLHFGQLLSRFKLVRYINSTYYKCPESLKYTFVEKCKVKLYD